MSDFCRIERVKARKRYRCIGCYGPILKGEIHPYYVGVWEGDWGTWRMHEECFQVQADDDDSLIAEGEFPIPPRVRVIMDKERAGVPISPHELVSQL
jgi:hypothetical protein